MIINDFILVLVIHLIISWCSYILNKLVRVMYIWKFKQNMRNTKETLILLSHET